MCAYIGINTPFDDDAVVLYKQLARYISERANSAIDGAANAILALHRAGYRLYTASGTTSWELLGIMKKMGIASAFSGLYGPDLIDHVKYGHGYYQKVFMHSGIEPGKALVIDSDSECCQWASKSGATAIWVNPNGKGDVTTLSMLVQQLA